VRSTGVNDEAKRTLAVDHGLDHYTADMITRRWQGEQQRLFPAERRGRGLLANSWHRGGGRLGEQGNSYAAEQRPQDTVDPLASRQLKTRMCESGTHPLDPTTNCVGGGALAPKSVMCLEDYRHRGARIKELPYAPP
jgi:hypothetical protein